MINKPFFIHKLNHLLTFIPSSFIFVFVTSVFLFTNVSASAQVSPPKAYRLINPLGAKIKLTPAPTSTPTPTLAPTSTPIPTSIPTNTPKPAQNIAVQVAQSQNASDAEKSLFDKTNNERTKNGLPPLVWDDRLAGLARAHSQDMVDKHYFNHVDQSGASPFDRMKAAGITYNSAGENIASGPSTDNIHNGWMNSEGHKKNILQPSFGKIGIGVVTDPDYGLTATQDFTN